MRPLIMLFTLNLRLLPPKHGKVDLFHIRLSIANSTPRTGKILMLFLSLSLSLEGAAYAGCVLHLFIYFFP